MKKLDKKQVPQFIALCILSAGTFGYFVVRLVTPSPAAAGTRTRPVQEAAKPSLADASPRVRNTGPGMDAASSADAPPAPAPTAGMRDPFVVGYVDPKTITASTPPATTPATNLAKAATQQVASIHAVGPALVSAPLVPGLPLGLKGFSSPSPSLPAAPPAPALPQSPASPAWTVTGVLQNDTQHIAILRNGEARRIVRTGDLVDSQYRVVDVTRTSVALRHGTAVYHLMLGGVKTTPAPVKTVPAPVMTLPVPKPTAKPQKAAFSPAQQSANLKGSLTAMIQSGVTLAQSFFAAARTSPALPISDPAAPVHTAALYPESGTEWQQILMINNSEAAQAAETLLTPFSFNPLENHGRS